MAIRIELSLRLPNSPGRSGGCLRLLSDERVNILAMGLESGGQLRLVVDNHIHGAAVLREHHHQVTERDVILVAGAERAGVAGAGAAADWRRRRERRVRVRRRQRHGPDRVDRDRRRGRAARGRRGGSVVRWEARAWIEAGRSSFQPRACRALHFRYRSDSLMRLYVEPMDAVVIEVTEDGRVRLEDEELAVPTLQERRAILYSARGEIEALTELVDILERQP